MDRMNPGPAQGALVQFQVSIAQEQVSSEETRWEELAQVIPKNDNEWQHSRQQNYFDTPERILATTDRVLAPESNDLNGIRRIILLAKYAVIKHFTTDTNLVYSYLKPRLSKRRKPVANDTIDRQIKAVQKLVQLMDELYLKGLRHRAYEAVLLYAPTLPTYLRLYTDNPDKFKDCFTICEPEPEIQASLPLYLPFLVFYQLQSETHKLKQPLNFGNICETLETHLLGEDEYVKFAASLQTKTLELRPLTLPVRLCNNEPATSGSLDQVARSTTQSLETRIDRVACRESRLGDGDKQSSDTARSEAVSQAAILTSSELVRKRRVSFTAGNCQKHRRPAYSPQISIPITLTSPNQPGARRGLLPYDPVRSIACQSLEILVKSDDFPTTPLKDNRGRENTLNLEEVREPNSTSFPLTADAGTKSRGDGLDILQFVDVENIYLATLQISLFRYMIIATSEELQEKALRAGREQTGRIPTENCDISFFAYAWDDSIHDAVADQAVSDLVRLKILTKGEDIYRRKVSIHHDSGGLITEEGWFQIVVPTAIPTQPYCITLSGSNFTVPVAWDVGLGLLLQGGTVLSTTSPIDYISISIPIDASPVLV